MGCDCFKSKNTTSKPTLVEPLNNPDISMDTNSSHNSIFENINAKSILTKSNRTSNCEINKELNLYDFDIIKSLGRGAYGTVALVNKHKSKDSKLYAMKIINKYKVKKNEQYDNVKTEREVLAKLDNPFVLKLCYAFQNTQNLYLLTEFIQGGELVFHLREKGKFKESWVKFYAAEIIIAIECLHSNNLIYRDLKPENILLDCEGHIKLIDFGLSKIMKNNKEKDEIKSVTFSICGTPEYLAPEIIKETGYDKCVDWWSLGVLIYELLTGSTPFYDAKSHMDLSVYQRQIEMPLDFSDAVIDLLESLLQLNPDQRLGRGEKGSEQVMNHIFFKGINWNIVKARKLVPPIIPKLANEVDISNFSQNSCFLNHTASIRSKKSTDAHDFSSNISTKETDPDYYDNFYYDYEKKDDCNDILINI